MAAAARLCSFAGRHHQVEEEVVVAADEAGHPGHLGGGRPPCSTTAGSRSRSSIRVPARLRLWPSSPICTIWPISALTSTGPVRPQRGGERGAEHGAHPAQPFDDLGAVGAVPQHLAQSLVEGAPARLPVRLVAQHPGPHRRRHHAGHRAHAAHGRGTGTGRSACRRQPAGLPAAPRPPPGGRAATSSSIAPISAPRSGPLARVPVDRRAGVAELPRAQADHLGRRPDVHKGRPGREHPGHRRRVGGDPARDRRRPGPGRPRCPAAAGASRRGRCGAACVGQRVGQRGRPDRDDPRLPASSPVTTPPSRGLAAWRAASALEAIHRRPGLAQRRGLPVEALRVVGRADQRHHHGQRRLPAQRPRMAGASSAAGSGWAPWPSTTSSSRTPTRGSAASRCQHGQPGPEVDHRVGAADGVLVVAEVEHPVCRDRGRRRADRPLRTERHVGRDRPEQPRGDRPWPRRRACRR